MMNALGFWVIEKTTVLRPVEGVACAFFMPLNCQSFGRGQNRRAFAPLTWLTGHSARPAVADLGWIVAAVECTDSVVRVRITEGRTWKA